MTTTLDVPTDGGGRRLPAALPHQSPRPDTTPLRRGTPADDALRDALALDRFRPQTLSQVLAAAELQTRVDRKYLVPIRTARAALADLDHSHGLLSIDERATTGYSTVYFDLVDWAAFRAHAQGRRRRWKIRTRLYLEDRLCRLELKTKESGTTVKHSQDQPASAHGRLGPDGRDFLRGGLAAYGAAVDVDRLLPGVVVTYRRATLCDLSGGTRLTVDAELAATLDGRRVRLRPDHVLIETKGGRSASPADLALRSHGARPVSVSKYSVMLSLLDPTLPGHCWRPFGRRYFTDPEFTDPE